MLSASKLGSEHCSCSIIMSTCAQWMLKTGKNKCACACACACMCVCVYVCVYLYIYIYKEREGERSIYIYIYIWHSVASRRTMPSLAELRDVRCPEKLRDWPDAPRGGPHSTTISLTHVFAHSQRHSGKQVVYRCSALCLLWTAFWRIYLDDNNDIHSNNN